MTYSSTWKNYNKSLTIDKPDITRAVVEFYRNTSSATSGGTLVKSVSYYYDPIASSSSGPSTDNGTTYSTLATYDTGSDAVNNNNKYFYVIEKQYNSGTDYAGTGPVQNLLSTGPITVLSSPGAFTYSISDSTITPSWPSPNILIIQSSNYDDSFTVNWGAASPISAYFITLTGTPKTLARTGNGSSTSYGTYVTATGNETATVEAENNNTYCGLTATASTNAQSYVWDYSDGVTRTTVTTSTPSYRFAVANGNTATVYGVVSYLGLGGTGRSTAGTLSGVSTNTPTTKIVSSSSSETSLTYYFVPYITSCSISNSNPKLDTQNGNDVLYSNVTAYGNPAPTLTYKWQLFSGGWIDMGTGSSITPIGSFPYRFIVTATNALSSATATSNTVNPTWNPPGQITAPSISGSGQVGTAISSFGGTYKNASSVVTDIAESVNPANFSSSSPSAGVGSYTVTSSDATAPAWYFATRDKVTAYNGSGTQSYFSGSIKAVPAPAPPSFFAPPGFFTPPVFFAPPGFFTPPQFFGPPKFGTSSIRFKKDIVEINSFESSI